MQARIVRRPAAETCRSGRKEACARSRAHGDAKRTIGGRPGRRQGLRPEAGPAAVLVRAGRLLGRAGVGAAAGLAVERLSDGRTGLTERAIRAILRHSSICSC